MKKAVEQEGSAISWVDYTQVANDHVYSLPRAKDYLQHHNPQWLRC